MNTSSNLDLMHEPMSCADRNRAAKTSLIVPILTLFIVLIGFVLAALAVSERIAALH